MPVDDFWKQVSQTQTWLESTHPPAEWAAQAKTWADIQQVIFADGQVERVDTSAIVRLMNADNPDLKALKTYFAGLARSQEQWSQAECGDCKAGLLSAILARPEFGAQDQASDPLQRFFQQLQDKIMNWLNSLFSGPASSSGLPADGMIVVISLLLAGIMAFVLRDFLRGMAVEAELALDASGEDQPLNASLANQRAVQLAESGDYRSAVRYLYLSALLLLDERGILRYNRSLTNREYLRLVSGQPDLEGHLRAVVDAFDRVWYGKQGIDRADYDRYVVHVDAIEALKK